MSLLVIKMVILVKTNFFLNQEKLDYINLLNYNWEEIAILITRNAN